MSKPLAIFCASGLKTWRASENDAGFRSFVNIVELRSSVTRDNPKRRHIERLLSHAPLSEHCTARRVERLRLCPLPIFKVWMQTCNTTSYLEKSDMSGAVVHRARLRKVKLEDLLLGIKQGEVEPF